MLRDFSQQEIVPTTFVLEESTNNLVGELSSDHNQLAYISDSEQPTPIKIMLKPPIEVSSAKPSIPNLSSDSGASYLSSLKIIPL